MVENGADAADRILLVDDNPTNLKVLFRALQQEGYELLIAQSGQEALQISAQARPQLVLLDINMPAMDGYETCRRLKSDPATSESVVIFLSARGGVDDKIKGLELGAVDYIEKPFQFEEVVARVRKHLEQFHQQRKLKHENQLLREKADSGFQEFTRDQIVELIQGGESDFVEFKSTLRYNLHASKFDKRIENACLKTVAAYLNSDGGILFVGVDDEGNALGLDQDDFANDDKLLLHWNGLVKQVLGVDVCQRIRSTVEIVAEKQVLLVQCLTSSNPVFFSREQDEKFFVRTGNGTHALKPSEVLAYLDQRK